MLGDPQVLVLDEPATGLDPEGTAWLRGLLRDLAGQSRTVLVSSHLLAEVQQLADRLVILAHGRLVAHRTLAELTSHHGPVVAVDTPQPEALVAALAGARERGAQVERLAATRLRVTGLRPAEIGHLAATAGVELHGLAGQPTGLEEVFLALNDRAGHRTRPAGPQPGDGPGGAGPTRTGVS